MRNSVVLPAPFGPITPTMPPGGSLKVRSSISSLSPKPLVRPSKSMTFWPSRSATGMTICAVCGLLVAGLLQQVLIALIARLGLGLARLGRGRDPFLLGGQRALARLFLAAFLLQPLLLLAEPGGVIALVGNALAAIEFENPAGDVVEEVAIMGHDQDRARIIAQMAFQPGHGFGVEMVGRFVEQQQFGRVEQQLAERDAALLAAGQRSPRRHRRAGSAARPSPDRPWNRDPTGPAPRSRPAARSSRRRSRRNNSSRVRCSGRGSPSAWRRLPSRSRAPILSGSSCGSCGR